MRRPIGGLLLLALAGCATSSGEPANGFLTSQIAQGYIPLDHLSMFLVEGHGAAFVIAPGVAVTNAHNASILRAASIIGESRNYDLLFFRVDSALSLPTMAPQAGERVIAYGQGAKGELRVAQGLVRNVSAPVLARCSACAVQAAFTFEGNAGPGFSGGPVIDAATGKLVGITFGYLDPQGHRLMYAYTMARIRNELAAVTHNLPVDVN